MTPKFFFVIVGLMLFGCNSNTSIKTETTKSSSNMTFNELFDNWISGIIKTESPGKRIIAYKFGIFETTDIPSGYYLYLVGSKEYDEDDDDWAAGFGDYQPKNTYLGLPENEFKNVEWEKVEEMIIKKVKAFIKTDDYKSSFFNNAKAIVVGFDEGDLVRVR